MLQDPVKERPAAPAKALFHNTGRESDESKFNQNSQLVMPLMALGFCIPDPNPEPDPPHSLQLQS